MQLKKLTLTVLFSVLVLSFVLLLHGKAAAQQTYTSLNPARVYVGVWLVNVEKIDLAASSYRL
ncbi:MAG: hypothetical protein QXZ51_06025, partial [Candidatus Bathyarchaeia archaeon]